VGGLNEVEKEAVNGWCWVVQGGCIIYVVQVSRPVWIVECAYGCHDAHNIVINISFPSMDMCVCMLYTRVCVCVRWSAWNGH